MTLLSPLVITGFIFLISTTPAEAGLIGTGPAVSHVDAAKATVTKLADNLYSISMPKRTSGQWMGVRRIKGKNKIKVGDLTAKQLSVGWSRLLYTSSPVRGTLTWKECCNKMQSEPVHIVGKPKRTSRGVIFNITSIRSLPPTLNEMSIHLAHASNDQVNQPHSTRSAFAQSSDLITTFPSTQTENIIDDLWISSYNQTDTSVELRIYNSSNNNTCWSYTWNYIPDNYPTSTHSVGSNTCDNVSYTNGDTAIPYGGRVELDNYAASVGQTAQSSFYLAVTPPGEASYNYFWDFESWSWSE